MKAQFLYDLREKHEFCSGSDLHDFFQEQTGDPSPSGKVAIDVAAASELVLNGCAAIEHNSKIGMELCRIALKVENARNG